MKSKANKIRCLLLVVSWLGMATTSYATVIYDVTLNTSPLIGHAAGPFSLDFQLTDGRGIGDANNSAVLSDFRFGAGSAAGSPTLLGGATGNLFSTVTLNDSAFLNEFRQRFMPGALLQFTLSLTTDVDSGGTPDQFSFAILDRTGAEIPTLAGSPFDVLVSIDLNSPNPTVQTFGSDPSRSPAGGGGPINMNSPAVTVIPEPGTVGLLSVSLVVLSVWRRNSNLTLPEPGK